MSSVLAIYCVRHVGMRMDMDEWGGGIGIGRLVLDAPVSFLVRWSGEGGSDAG